jgi:glycosyltransferase involved in cell wall biosynthesis
MQILVKGGLLISSIEATDIPLVSIVICTYNRKQFLNDCLNSIFRMDYPNSKFEIIIVDGGSSDGTGELQSQFPTIRFVTEKQFGLAHARNLGAQLARGSIVAYTDDDCIVGKYWLKNLIQGFQCYSTVVGVGGPAIPNNSMGIPKKIFVKQALGFFDEGKETKFVNGIITSNSAFRKKIFDTIKFDETLAVTRRGKLILCGEDVDFCEAIAKSNYKLLYVPEAKVYHRTTLNRLKVSYIVRHALHRGISYAKSFRKAKNSRIWMIRFAIVRTVRSFFKIIDDKSFATCYEIIASMSTLFFCVTGSAEVVIYSQPVLSEH